MQKSRYLRIHHERSPEHLLILLKSAFKWLSRTIDGTQERKRGNGPGFITAGGPWPQPRGPRPRSHPRQYLGEASPCTGFPGGEQPSPGGGFCPGLDPRWGPRSLGATAKPQPDGPGPGSDAAWQSTTQLLTSPEINVGIEAAHGASTERGEAEDKIRFKRDYNRP